VTSDAVIVVMARWYERDARVSSPRVPIFGVIPWSEIGADRGTMPASAAFRSLDHVPDHNDLEFPRFAAPLMATVLLATAAVVVGQHHFARAAIAWTAIAVGPSLAAITGVKIPRLLCSAATLVGVAGLLSRPAFIDASPYLFIFDAAEIAAGEPLRRALPVVLAEAAVPVGWDLAGRFDHSFLYVVGILLGATAGALLGSQMRLVTRLRAMQAQLAGRAALEERQRIAREVHDVVAHSLTVTMLHVTGARLALGTGDVDDAVDALRDAETTGRQSLADIRRTVGLLASDDIGALGPPAPDARDIDTLVASYTSAGRRVTLTVDGDVSRLAPATGLALYRIAQESLANAAKHAPGAAAALEITVGADRVQLRVHNPMDGTVPADGAGLGLSGMRQRAQSCGGHVDAGPGGAEWVVHADLPVTP
jgi:signal transduction histidine kinase